MIVDTDKVLKWAEELEERLTKLNVFQQSEFWLWIANKWSLDVIDIIENNDRMDQHYFEENIFKPISEHLTNAEDEIDWAPKSKASFQSITNDLVYPLAWDLWDRSTFPINITNFSGVTEIIGAKEKKRILGKNNTDSFSKNSVFMIQENDQNNFKIEIPLSKLDVNPGATVYSGSAKASELHIISKVPSIPDVLGIQDTVDRVLDTNLKRNEWQRPLIINRTKHIQNFLKTAGNFFMNPVILHLDNSSGNDAKIITKADGSQYLFIDLSTLFISNDPKMENFIMLGDKRPLDIIDGQHRVIGAARSVNGNDLRIPFIIAPPNTYTTDHAAKLFTEINTTSQELEKDHQLYLAFRYSLPHYKSELTMDLFDIDKRNFHDRANRMAYQLAAELSSPDMSLMYHIKFLQANSSNYCVDITKWQKYVKRWFMPGNPYDADCELEYSDIVKETNNYFIAWINTIGESWVGEDNKGWNNRTVFQRKTHFRVLLNRFVQVYDKLRKAEKIASVDEFSAILIPMKNLQSNNPEFIEKFAKSTGEFPWKCLDVWVMDAIDNGISYSTEEIHSANTPGVAGKGIMSGVLPSDRWVIEDDSRGNWPTAMRVRYLKVHRPKNCYQGMSISVHDGNEVLTGISNQRITANNDGICNVPIRPKEELNNRDVIELRLRWSNQIGTQEKRIFIRKD